MTPEQLQQFNELKRQVDELTQWKEQKQHQQFTMPLDNTSVEILNQALLNARLLKTETKSLVLTVGNTDNPTIEGEMVYHGTTPSIKVLLGGVVKTITVT